MYLSNVVRTSYSQQMVTTVADVSINTNIRGEAFCLFGIGLKKTVDIVCRIIVLCLNSQIVPPEQRKQQKYSCDRVST